MREIKKHRVKGDYYSNRVVVKTQGDRGAGGANMSYSVAVDGGIMNTLYIAFQNGNPEEQINGVSNESLLAIVLDRLEGFQSGKFPSNETAQAMEHVERALASMNHRTRERMERGVIGELKK